MWTALLFNRFTGAALALALAGGAYWNHRTGLIQKGYDTAMAEVQAAETDRLRELLREYSRLIEKVKGIQDAYTDQTAEVAAFRARLRAADQRLRQQAADFDARIATASSQSLRDHAAATDRDFERCIGDVERFTGEAAACSGAAHALKANLDAITAAPTPAPTEAAP